MPDAPDLSQPVALATFTPLTPSRGEAIAVHFNPASLQYTLANSIKEEGGGSRKKQYVDKTSAQLTMQLVFDTTDTGEDVRAHTERMAALLKPLPDGGKQVPPNVEFGWGAYRFTGMVEQYRETIDFFAASGVPLRASVDLTLASQDVQFESERNPSASVDRELAPEPAVVPSGDDGPAGLANALGDPRAARAIGVRNGAPSLRTGTAAGLAVGGGVRLQAEAAFATGASSAAGAGSGIAIGGGAGFGAGLEAGAAGGAFAGLRSGAGPVPATPGPRPLFETPGASAAVGADARFGIGGRAQSRAGSSLGADVGTGADLNALIKFG